MPPHPPTPGFLLNRKKRRDAPSLSRATGETPHRVRRAPLNAPRRSGQTSYPNCVVPSSWASPGSRGPESSRASRGLEARNAGRVSAHREYLNAGSPPSPKPPTAHQGSRRSTPLSHSPRSLFSWSAQVAPPGAMLCCRILRISGVSASLLGKESSWPRAEA